LGVLSHVVPPKNFVCFARKTGASDLILHGKNCFV
jgi:hypothetical protein